MRRHLQLRPKIFISNHVNRLFGSVAFSLSWPPTRWNMKTAFLKIRPLLCLSIFATLFITIATSSFSLYADETPSLIALPLEGAPVLMSSNREPFKLIREVSLHPNDYIQTGPGGRALIKFAGDKVCKFILEPNSVFKLGGQTARGIYRVYLLDGAMLGENTSCQVMMDIRTNEGRLLGKNASYRLQALSEKTRIQLVSGNMQFHIQGQAVPLRAKTLTTISRSGNHRISSMARLRGRGTARRTTNLSGTNLKSGIVPIAATAGQP